MAHILNGCPLALEQGRYTWRHDCVLSIIIPLLLDITSLLKQKIYADLPNLEAIPLAQFTHSFLVTPLKPDLVLLRKGDYQGTVIELTCSTNT